MSNERDQRADALAAWAERVQSNELKPKVWQSPSEAIKHDACAVCLGGGETFDIILNRLGPCSQCGGSGLLADMLANQCDDPDCPEHHGN